VQQARVELNAAIQIALHYGRESSPRRESDAKARLLKTRRSRNRARLAARDFAEASSKLTRWQRSKVV